MLNYLWGAMLLLGIVYGAFQGRLPEITTAALDSAREAVTLCVTMMGVVSLWVGLMEIAQKSGLIELATRKIRPFINYMFPRIPKNHKAREYITTNIIANIFGLGWAATPAGLKAMEALEELEEERRSQEMSQELKLPARRTGQHSLSVPRGVASNEMCTFLILNISSLQLLPVNVIAYRSQYGSANPASIAGPCIVATLLSLIAAIIFCKWMERTTSRRWR